jgi:hypothetical protein
MNEKLTAAIDRYDEAIHKMPESDIERESAARNLITTMREAKKTETALIEKMHVELIMAAENVNRCADEKDINRNRVSYGIARTCAGVLRLLGIEAICNAWEDEGFLKISEVTIAGKTTEFHNGK